MGYGVRGTGYFGVWGESDRAGGYGLTGRNTNTDGTGVKGVTNDTDGRAGVRGEGRIGVWGSSPNVRQAGVKGDGVTGVWGVSSTTSYSGVYGEHTGTHGHGTVGIGKGEAAGVLGRNNTGEGVRGEGRIGVRGISAIAGQAEVYAEHRGTDGPGVIGDGSGSDYAGVLGRNASGTGVWGQSGRSGYSGVHGEHTGTNGNGVVGDGKGGDNAGVLGRNPGGSGVRGESPSGYGGSFKGGKAQLMLVPGSSRGKPTAGTHTRGEIYMDSAGTLFVCTVGDGTTVGTWRKLTSTTA